VLDTFVVLILIMHTHGFGGPTVSMAQFADEEACRSAGDAVQSVIEAEYYCVPASGHRPVAK
jgi:hypothetical protein